MYKEKPTTILILKRKARSSLDSRNVDYSKNTQGESYEFGFYLGALLRLVAQTVKNLPVMQETWVRSLGWKDTLEDGMATHSNILA